MAVSLQLKKFIDVTAPCWAGEIAMRGACAAAVLFLSILVAGGAVAQPVILYPPQNDETTGCHEKYTIVDACTVFRGRIFLTATGGLRVWLVGTKRMPEAFDVPSWIADIVLDDFFSTIYADFEVCPMEKYVPGLMQRICLEKASRVRVERPSNSDNRRLTPDKVYIYTPPATQERPKP